MEFISHTPSSSWHHHPTMFTTHCGKQLKTFNRYPMTWLASPYFLSYLAMLYPWTNCLRMFFADCRGAARSTRFRRILNNGPPQEFWSTLPSNSGKRYWLVTLQIKFLTPSLQFLDEELLILWFIYLIRSTISHLANYRALASTRGERCLQCITLRILICPYNSGLRYLSTE